MGELAGWLRSRGQVSEAEPCGPTLKTKIGVIYPDYSDPTNKPFSGVHFYDPIKVYEPKNWGHVP